MQLPTRQFASIALAFMLVLSAVPMGAAAQQSDSGPLGVFDDTAEDASRMQQAGAAATAALDRVEYYLASQLPDAVPFVDGNSTEDVDTHAQEITDEVNQHNASIETYINTHVSDSVNKTDYDVVRLDLEDADGNERTIYAVSTVNSSTDNVSEMQVVNSTNRTVDYTLVLSDFASQEFSEDLQWARENYVSEDRAPDGRIRGRFTAKYAGGHIDVQEGEP